MQQRNQVPKFGNVYRAAISSVLGNNLYRYSTK